MMPAPTDALALQAVLDREARERRTALAAAFRNAARKGTTIPESVADLLRSRHDGTPAAIREDH